MPVSCLLSGLFRVSQSADRPGSGQPDGSAGPWGSLRNSATRLGSRSSSRVADLLGLVRAARLGGPARAWSGDSWAALSWELASVARRGQLPRERIRVGFWWALTWLGSLNSLFDSLWFGSVGLFRGVRPLCLLSEAIVCLFTL